MIPQEYADGSRAAGRQRLSNAALRVTTWSWAAVMLTGQLLFVYYLLARYGVSALSGDFDAWQKTPPKGYVPGDTAGNVAFGTHLLIATIVFVGGLLQLVPQIRQRAAALHRWNGRAFMLAAAAASVGGLYMVWVRQAAMNTVNAVAVSVDAVLILAFVTVAWRAALARDFIRHRRWALRTFMVANAVFFVRIFTFGWMLLTQGAGMTERMNGPMNHFLEFAAYLLPLAVLELYLRARASARPSLRFAAAFVLLLATVYMAMGTFAYTTHKWQMLG